MSCVQNWVHRLNLSAFVCFSFFCCGELCAATLNDKIADKEEAFIVRRIAEFCKDQDYQIVKKEIQKFTEQYPKSAMNDYLRGMLGDILIQEQNYEGALRVYDQVSDKEICEKIMLNKLQCLYELSEYARMLEWGRSYVGVYESAPDARSQEFLFLMAEAFYKSPHAEKEELEQAKQYYEKVLDSAYKDAALFSLAEIYRKEQNFEKAAETFLDLASRHKDQAEELTFHAALALSSVNPEQAISLFGQITSQQGFRAKEAAINTLILHYQQENYEQVIATYEDLILGTEYAKEDLYNYVLGRSYFAKEDFDNASKYLQKYIAVTETSTQELRNALLMRLNCAQILQQTADFQATLDRLHAGFPEDKELEQASFIHAMMLKDAGDLGKAEALLARLLQTETSQIDRATLLLEHGVLAHKSQHYPESYHSLQVLLEKFPQSEHEKLALKYFLANAYELYKNDASFSKERFFDNLEMVLAQEDVLNDEEQKESRFLQGKLAYDLERYSQASGLFTQFIQAYPQGKQKAQAHLYIALCHQKLNNTPEDFCKHAEIALQSDESLQQSGNIRIELYNAYLAILDGLTGDDPALVEQRTRIEVCAADHLYQALQLGDTSIHQENLFWLANHFYSVLFSEFIPYAPDGDLPDEDNRQCFDKCLSILEGLLLCPDDQSLKTIGAHEIFKEFEALKLAHLYGKTQRHKEKIALLQTLAQQQAATQNYNWKLKYETLFELAKTFELHKESTRAHETYTYIASQAPSNTFIKEYANVCSFRLENDQTSPSDTDTQTLQKLCALKETQIKKQLSTEPLHLDAAIEYASLRAHLAPENEATEKYLFFLERIQEDFLNTEDPLVVEYQNSLKDSPQCPMYEQYMTFIESEIFRMKSRIAEQPDEQKQLAKRSQELLSEIQGNPLTFTLQQRVEQLIAR